MKQTRDELLAWALNDLPVAAHAAGFERSLHEALVSEAPAVRRAYAHRRLAWAVTIAAVMIALAAGVSWARFRAVPPPPPVRQPVVIPSIEPTRTVPLKPLEEEPTEPPSPPSPDETRPSDSEAEHALVVAASSVALPERALEAKVRGMVKTDDAWWVAGFVRPKPDWEVQTDHLMVVLRRPFGEERWKEFYAGTELTLRKPLADQLPGAPDEVLALVRDDLLGGRPPWPPEHTEANVRKFAPNAAGSFVLEKNLTSATHGVYEGSDVRVACDSEDTWWASVLVTVTNNAGQKLDWTRVYMRWRPQDDYWQYVTSGKDVDLAKTPIPAEVRGKL